MKDRIVPHSIRFTLKTLISFFLLIFLSNVETFAQPSDTALINVRNFRIKKKRILSLQSPIENYQDIVVKSNDTHYYLKKEAFVGVDSIDLKINMKNQIEKVTCFYDSLTTFKDIVKAFDDHLKYKAKQTKSENIRKAKWEDKNTMFEIIETKSGKKRQVYCEITGK